MAGGKSQPFNNPFANPARRQALLAVVAAPPTPARAAQAPQAALARALTPEEEAALWEEATRGAVRVGGALRPAASGAVLEARSGVWDPDDAACEALRRFVRGEGSLDVMDADEWVESPRGAVPDHVMARLRQGAYSVQGYVDLHGLWVEEARAVLTEFLRRAQHQHHRCVLVVHGRGLHSKDQLPVIKQRVTAWLSRGGLSRRVLAFCTARPHDGGAGALYVLLCAAHERGPRRRRRNVNAAGQAAAGQGAPRAVGAGLGAVPDAADRPGGPRVHPPTPKPGTPRAPQTGRPGRA